MESPTSDASRLIRAWGDFPRLTPKQARAITCTLDVWGDEIQSEWLTAAPREPLHTISPFDRLDLRVMMLVGENAAWAAAAAGRCHVVAEEIVGGVLPFDRDGCFFDELLMALVLREAPDLPGQLPDLFAGLPERAAPPMQDDGNEDADVNSLGDEEWAIVAGGFDDACRWDEWEVPAMNGHVLLPAILSQHHPFRWFDPGAGTGSGHLLRLAEEQAAAAEQ